MNREHLAEFLRNRREALQPQDVGLSRGVRRRTAGLRREEVAMLAGMSTDYLSRLEQRRGPQPSLQMLGALGRALHLSIEELDYLFRLAGHNAPPRSLRADHINPGMLRVFDRLHDTPAQIMGGLGETLLQNALAVALLGDETHFVGMARSVGFRWFTDPAARRIYPEEDHALHSRSFVSDLRAFLTLEGASQAANLVAALLETSPEFADLWSAHIVDGEHGSRRKRIVHPQLGLLEIECQRLFDVDRAQGLLVFTATPASESYEKLELLAVLGSETMTTGHNSEHAMPVPIAPGHDRG
jgi:transcriptional regulator with XRE-family HTH domain